jgi:hypothetical protein
MTPKMNAAAKYSKFTMKPKMNAAANYSKFASASD